MAVNEQEDRVGEAEMFERSTRMEGVAVSGRERAAPPSTPKRDVFFARVRALEIHNPRRPVHEER